jgi:prepilin-type processing-associated H-X9-DG protein
MTTYNVLVCPDDSNRTVGSGSVGIGISYAANSIIDPYSYMGGVIALYQPWWINDNTVTNANIPFPTDTISIAEKHNDQVMQWIASNQAGDTGGGNASGYAYGSLFTGFNWWDWTAPGEIPNGTAPAPTTPAGAYPNGPNGAVSATHTGLANFLFCDGHVKAMIPSHTNPDPTNLPNKNLWDRRRTSDN